MSPDSPSAIPVDRRVSPRALNESAEDEAVETFTFDVSAGKQPPITEAAITKAAVVLRPRNVAESPAIAAQVRARAVRPKRITLSRRQLRMSPFGLSLLAHIGIIAALSAITIPGLSQQFAFSLSFDAEPAVSEEVLIDEIVVDPLDELENAEHQLVEELSQVSAMESDLNSQVALAHLSSDSLSDAALSDAAALFGSQGSGLSELVPQGGNLTASFFGTKVEGRRILYVLDNSGGMRDGGLEALVEELTRSVESLTEEQQFYVIFYSDMVYPMFHPRPVERFVPANDRFKKRLSGWLDSVEFSVGNTVDEAIAAAGMIKPDALYLLTDGDINTTRDGRKLAALVDSRGRDFPIHTFGIGMSEGTKAAINLQSVADANGGKFRIVEISPEAKQRAREKNRPYHNKEPGPTWGLNVGRGWGRK
jgi:hypothetical protein